MYMQNNSEEFENYLKNSSQNPFVINLSESTLMEIVDNRIKVKEKIHPNYGKSLACLVYNLKTLESQYDVTLQPIQITDIFWSYFISFCEQRGLKPTSIETMCYQLKSILAWAAKYNAPVSPTYDEIRVKHYMPMEIALTSDEVSRITYFDIDRFYSSRRLDYKRTMHKIRDMFVLSCNLFQRYSDMVRIEPVHFDRNIFRITQQKTGNVAVVNIDQFSIEPKTTYRILEKYGYKAPFNLSIGNYNWYLHKLMRDIGFSDLVRIEEKRGGEMKTEMIPKWKLITSHTARRTAITIGILRGHNIHALRKCSGHSDIGSLDRYIFDE